jgi:hypothetical protein
MQVMIQARAAAQEESDAFKRWSLEQWAPRVLEEDAGVARLIVNLATAIPALQPYGNAESLGGDAFDVVVQIYLQNGSDYERVVKPNLPCLQDRSGAYHAYRVTESEVLHKPALIRSAPTPGIKLMRGLFIFEDLPDTAARRMWAHHSSLAEKVHVGLARYARHWVDGVLTEGSPMIRGLSDLHFPDEQTMRDLYFDSPRGRDEIMHDLGHFIAGGTQRFCGQEYVLK